MLVTSISYASVLFGTAGALSAASLYLSFSFGSLLSNWVLERSRHHRAARYEYSYPLRRVLIYGQIGLLVFHCACLFYAKTVVILSDNNAGNAFRFVRVIASCILVIAAIVSGLSVGIAWPAAGAFTTKSALALSSTAVTTDYGGDSATNSASVHVTLEGSSEQVQLLSTSTSIGSTHISNYGSRPGDLNIEEVIQNNMRKKNTWLFQNNDFHSWAGNLNGLFTGILIVSILLGHIFSAIELHQEELVVSDDYNNCNRHVVIMRVYTQLLCGGLLSTLIMTLFVFDPPSSLLPSSLSSSSPVTAVDDAPTLPSLSVFNSILYPLQLTFRHPELFNLVGSHITSGFRSGLILSFVGGTIIEDPSLIGVFLALKMICSLVVTPLFAMLGNSHSCNSSRTTRFGLFFGRGRISVLYVGWCCDLLVTLLALVAYNYHQSVSSSSSNGDANNVSPLVLCCIYIFGGIGFAAWQGTTSGALLSEIAAYLVVVTRARTVAANKDDDDLEDANSVLTAAFSGCKAVSGTASAIAFFVFSADNHNRIPIFYIFGMCIIGQVVGLVQLVYGHYTNLWSSMVCTTTIPLEDAVIAA